MPLLPVLPLHNHRQAQNLPTKKDLAAELVTQYFIGKHDTATIYMSPDPYHQAFEEDLDLRKFDMARHRTAGFSFLETDG